MKHFKFLLAAATALTLAQAASAATLNVGTEGDYKPFNYVSPDGKILGFDYDIGQAVCAEMKVDCKWSTNEWSGIIPALQTGKFDLMIASMAINEERKKQVAFSLPYYYNGMRFVAGKDAAIKEISAAALKGKVIGTQSGSVAVDTLKQYFPDNEVKLYPSLSEALLDLESGRADLVLESQVVLDAWLKKEGAACCEFVGETFILDSAQGNAMAVQLDNKELLGKVNAALEEIMRNGTYTQIRQKYFDFDLMQRPKNASDYLK